MIHVQSAAVITIFKIQKCVIPFWKGNSMIFLKMFENERFVSVASKLNKWQPVFGGELLRPLNPTVVSGAVVNNLWITIAWCFN